MVQAGCRSTPPLAVKGDEGNKEAKASSAFQDGLAELAGREGAEEDAKGEEEGGGHQGGPERGDPEAEGLQSGRWKAQAVTRWNEVEPDPEQGGIKQAL